MNFPGTLIKWNDDRGFGFIAPTQGGQELFVHISSFPHDGRRPSVGEALLFQIEQDKNGKKRATQVRRPVRAPRHMPTSTWRKDWSPFSRILGVLMLIALGLFVYTKYERQISRYGATPSSLVEAVTPDVAPQRVVAPPAPEPSLNMRCDGRIHCSQMSSCAEATFFLKHCPGVQMDGNHDGVPCEQQWCTGSFSK